MRKRENLSLSIDLDNLWAYLKVKGDKKWQTLPSYFEIFLPSFLSLLNDLQLKITFFIIGKDADQSQNKDLLKEIARQGHEIANHSYHHEPWLHLMTLEELKNEIILAEEAIFQATGVRTKGFRGPGFTWTEELLSLLESRGYLYDSSTLPTFIGPLARVYYFWISQLKKDEQKQREQLFGSLKEGLRPIKPYLWQLPHDKTILEMPVTTIPFLKTPFHLSYLMYLTSFSESLMKSYLKLSLSLCRQTNTAPNFLLHPPDFMDSSQVPDMSFFPGMSVNHKKKKELFLEIIEEFKKNYTVSSLSERAKNELSSPIKKKIP